MPDAPRDVPGDDAEAAPPEGGDDAGPCEAGLTSCGGTCVDTRADPANCGRCGEACPEAEHAIAICAGGSCGLECEPGWADLDGEPGCESGCVPAEPPVETCNGADDDCNGAADEGLCRVLWDVVAVHPSAGEAAVFHAPAAAGEEAVEVLRVTRDGLPAADPIVLAGTAPEIAALPGEGLVVAYRSGPDVRLARIGCTP